MKIIKIEYICPELCHFYGDHGNLLYLQKKAELMGNRIEIIKTSCGDKPAFSSGQVDMVYIGPTTENHQAVLIKALSLYRKELHDFIENDGYVLATGNSAEIFYDHITLTDGNQLDGLKFFPLDAQRFDGKRYSVNVIAEYEGQKIAGYKNLMTKTVTEHNPYPLFRVWKEKGVFVQDQWEGIHYRNLFATYLLGPILLQNPYFSNSLLKQLFGESYRECYVPFERESYEARIHDVMTAKHPDHNG